MLTLLRSVADRISALMQAHSCRTTQDGTKIEHIKAKATQSRFAVHCHCLDAILIIIEIRVKFYLHWCIGLRARLKVSG